MIFVTVGTHDQEFTRLLKKIDELALKVKEEIIVQRGYTRYIPKNCKSFKFSPDLKPYFEKSNLIIAHAGMGTSIEVLRQIKKPLILVPRQHKYKEHINDHQVGMARHFEKKWEVKVIYDIHDLTAELLNKYRKRIKMHDRDLKKLRETMKKIVLKVENENKKF